MQGMGARLARQVARRDVRWGSRVRLPHPRYRCKMGDIVKRIAVAVLLLALFGVAACGNDKAAPPAIEVPPWGVGA